MDVKPNSLLGLLPANGSTSLVSTLPSAGQPNIVPTVLPKSGKPEVIRVRDGIVVTKPKPKPPTTSQSTAVSVPSLAPPGTTPVMNPALNANMMNNNLAFQAFLASGGNASTLMMKMLEAQKAAANGSQPVIQKAPLVPGPSDPPKKNRLKVFANGYFMTFDKISSCKTKHFWRCEFKNTCKARMHTDPQNKKIDSFIHVHNHKAPTNEEIALYGLDPLNIIKNHVYVVTNVSDPTQRRKIRKQVAEQEAAAKRLEQHQEEELKKKQSAETMATIKALYAQMQGLPPPGFPPTSAEPPAQSTSSVTEASSQPTIVLPNPISPGKPTPTFAVPVGPAPPRQLLKRPLVDPTRTNMALVNHPNFRATFELALKLRRVWKTESRRVPRMVENSTTYFEFYVAKDEGSEENCYSPLRIEKRDKVHLKEALETFFEQKCEGDVLYGVASNINVKINQDIMESWDNGQFFLVDISDPTRWRMTYIDDKN
ncbi:unnamed protein product [Caenorhabditis brenneri]